MRVQLAASNEKSMDMHVNWYFAFHSKRENKLNSSLLDSYLKMNFVMPNKSFLFCLF